MVLVLDFWCLFISLKQLQMEVISNDDIGFGCCEFSVFSFVVLLNISLLILSISSGKAKLIFFSNSLHLHKLSSTQFLSS